MWGGDTIDQFLMKDAPSSRRCPFLKHLVTSWEHSLRLRNLFSQL